MQTYEKPSSPHFCADTLRNDLILGVFVPKRERFNIKASCLQIFVRSLWFLADILRAFLYTPIGTVHSEDLSHARDWLHCLRPCVRQTYIKDLTADTMLQRSLHIFYCQNKQSSNNSTMVNGISINFHYAHDLSRYMATNWPQPYTHKTPFTCILSIYKCFFVSVRLNQQ